MYRDGWAEPGLETEQPADCGNDGHAPGSSLADRQFDSASSCAPRLARWTNIKAPDLPGDIYFGAMDM